MSFRHVIIHVIELLLFVLSTSSKVFYGVGLVVQSQQCKQATVLLYTWTTVNKNYVLHAAHNFGIYKFHQENQFIENY